MLVKSRNVFLVIVLLFASITLTSCGSGSSDSSSSSTEFEIEEEIVDSGWTTTEGDNGNGYAVSCNFDGDESYGDLVYCKVHWNAQNTSNIPLEYYGYTYLVVDDSIYQTADAYADVRTVNPGSYGSSAGVNSFWIPYGGTITALFKADGPSDMHILDLSLYVTITNEG
jgi:hypothetical protein